MVTWNDVLKVWKYPEPERLSYALEYLGLNPENYSSPFDLARDLRSIIDERNQIVYVKGEPVPFDLVEDIINAIVGFFKWLWEQFMNLLSPYMPYVGLILLGSAITWFASGWYKALGAIPIIAAVYGILKKAGLVK